MLKQLGRLERTRSIIIVGFAVLMAVSLIFFYAPGRNSNYLEPTKSTEVVAKVNGAEVTVADIALQKEAVQSRYGGQISLAQLGLTNERILDGVIQKKIIEQEALRLGLAPPQPTLLPKFVSSLEIRLRASTSISTPTKILSGTGKLPRHNRETSNALSNSFTINWLIEICEPLSRPA
jgi:SurA N-terminal domain